MFSNSFDVLIPDPFAQTQWWYVNGSLDSTHNHWDFELVFFLRKTDLDQIGKVPMKWLRPRLSAAHFSYLKKSKSEDQTRFRYYQQGGLLSRNSIKTADDEFSIQLGLWSLTESNNLLKVKVIEADIRFELQLEFAGRLVAHGETPGFSPRSHGKHTGCEHVSFSRMRARGVVHEANAVADAVTGLCWLDFERQWLDSDRLKLGWDWFALHLSDGSDLMIYNFHRNMNSTEPNDFSFSTHIDAAGSVTHLSKRDFEIHPTRIWKSAETQASYPVGFEIRIPRFGLKLQTAAIYPACELNCRSSTFVAYWEGPVQVEGDHRGQYVSGRGFLELVGYDVRPSSLWIHKIFRPRPIESLEGLFD